MKYFFITIAIYIFLIIPTFVHGQEENIKIRSVRKAAFFDKTQELRDMTIVIPGERDRSWKNNLIGNKSVEKPSAFPENKDVITQNVQKSMGDLSVKGLIRSFDGISNVNGAAPPDTDGEVGPNHYFQIVNLSFCIFSKSGEILYGPVDNSTLWDDFIGPWTGTNDGDPIVIYDHIEDRWIASQFAINTNNDKYYELLAISETGDPLGAYYRYAFEYDDFNDFPKLSVWTNSYLATYNMFSGGFVGTLVSAFEKEKMLVGDPTAKCIDFGYYSSHFGMLPADIDGDLPPENSKPIILAPKFSNNQLYVYELDLDWINPNNSEMNATTTIPLGENSSYLPDGISQPNNQKLDALTYFLNFRLQYRNFGTYQSLLGNHTVNVENHAGIKWFELRKTSGNSWELYQDGVYSPDANNRWLGSIAQDEFGNIALAYNVSSDSVFPSIRYTGRTPDSPLGIMNIEEQTIYKGKKAQSGVERWGDYSCLTVDPVNDSIFWFTTEYTNGNVNWRTKIASFNFARNREATLNLVDLDTVCSNIPYVTHADITYANIYSWSSSGDGNFIYPALLNTTYKPGARDKRDGYFWLTIEVEDYNGDILSDSVCVYIMEAPDVYAGDNQIIDENHFTELNGTANNHTSVLWSTRGDGYFEDETSLSTVYHCGEEDLNRIYVQLYLNAYGNGACAHGEDDMMYLYFFNNDIETIEEKKDIDIHPNPTNSTFTLKKDYLQTGDYVIKIYDNSGKDLFTYQLKHKNGELSKKFDISALKPGTYYVSVNNAYEKFTSKIVKN